LSAALDEAFDDAGVDFEEVVTRHAWLAGNASWDDHDITAGKGMLESVFFGEEPSDFLGRLSIMLMLRIQYSYRNR
jgi:hypothetical protein